MSAITPGRHARLEWGIKASLVNYMSNDPQFAVSTSGDASFSVEQGVRMTGVADDSGELRFDGAVVLQAHHGALTLPLVGVAVSLTGLSIDDPAADPDRPDRLTLVHLDRQDDDGSGAVVYATRLAAGADALFMFTYLPDSPFDVLKITLDES